MKLHTACDTVEQAGAGLLGLEVVEVGWGPHPPCFPSVPRNSARKLWLEALAPGLLPPNPP